MDAPSLILIPPTPTPARSTQPSPLSTSTTVSGSSLPALDPSTTDRERSSSETTIVTIYSMYEEEEESWSTSASRTPADSTRRRPLSKDTPLTADDYRNSFILPHGRRVEDSGFYDATYDVMRSKHLSSMSGGNRVSTHSSDSTQLAYSDSRPASTYGRSSPAARVASPSGTARRSDVLSTSDAGVYYSPAQSRPPSRPQSRPQSRPHSRADSPHRKSLSSHKANGGAASDGHSMYATPPMSPEPLPRTTSPPMPSSSHLTIPTTPSTPPRRSPKTSSPDSKHSQLSLVPSEGEDPDAFHVRSTYAQLDVCGVKGDGIEEGVERTRARVGSNRASEIRAAEALANDDEKTRDLTPKEIQLLSSLDRYGFFVTPSHDRLILLPAAPLAKPLSRVTAASPQAPASPPLLRAQPPSPAPAKESRRTAKWGRMIVAQTRDEGGNVDQWAIRPNKEHKLRERTFKGIPDCWRSAAWEILMNRFTKTGKNELRRLAEQYRHDIDQPSSYDVQIDLDVPRTISGHVLFRTRYGQGQRSLFHVLHCLSLHCNTCGYCQGMGPIAATLLCYFDPERVYASLVRIHDTYAMHDIFGPGFPGLLEAIYVQERLTEQMMPAVYAAFKKHMVSTTSYATKWYITLFANTVPFQTQLRLWDIFLLEGRDIFVIIAVAIVWVYREHITSESANFETVLSLLSSFFVPQDEDALLSWTEKVISDKKLRDSMQSWRQEWKRLVAEGKDSTALL